MIAATLHSVDYTSTSHSNHYMIHVIVRSCVHASIQSTPAGHQSAFNLSTLIHCRRPARPSFTCFLHQYLDSAHFIDNPIELSRFLLCRRPSFYEGIPSTKVIVTSVSDQGWQRGELKMSEMCFCHDLS
jgi:hypothetical protein